ncbi:MAG: hypothetical protein OEW75_15140 [Cyclobacteriaceae bacterium]|nr:hypothetical protein [Cyclobacteriaceae bacterium]
MNLIDVFTSLNEAGGFQFKGTDGNFYSLDQAQSKGIDGKIVKVDNSDDLKLVVFGKKRVGVNDMKALEDLVGKDSKLYSAVFNSLSYLTQKKVEKA